MLLGVVLAGGSGTRFDQSAIAPETKLLARVDGEPVVTRAARTLTASSLDATVAVVGHERERVAGALPEEVEAVTNPDYEQGQSTSVGVGVERARERGAEAVLFALGDAPCVAVETVEAILDAYRERTPGIVAPRYEGQRGNPVLFDARHFDALASVEGDTGGRALLESEPVTWVEVSDPGIHRDVDTLADLRALQDESERG